MSLREQFIVEILNISNSTGHYSRPYITELWEILGKYLGNNIFLIEAEFLIFLGPCGKCLWVDILDISSSTELSSYP